VFKLYLIRRKRQYKINKRKTFVFIMKKGSERYNCPNGTLLWVTTIYINCMVFRVPTSLFSFKINVRKRILAILCMKHFC